MTLSFFHCFDHFCHKKVSPKKFCKGKNFLFPDFCFKIRFETFWVDSDKNIFKPYFVTLWSFNYFGNVFILSYSNQHTCCVFVGSYKDIFIKLATTNTGHKIIRKFYLIHHFHDYSSIIEEKIFSQFGQQIIMSQKRFSNRNKFSISRFSFINTFWKILIDSD